MEPLKPFICLAAAVEAVVADQLGRATQSNWQYERDMHRHYATALGLAAQWIRDAIAEQQQQENPPCPTTNAKP
jgi:hypothetical protein